MYVIIIRFVTNTFGRIDLLKTVTVKSSFSFPQQEMGPANPSLHVSRSFGVATALKTKLTTVLLHVSFDLPLRFKYEHCFSSVSHSISIPGCGGFAKSSKF